MFCQYCGSKLDEDSAFCSCCGKKVPEERIPQEIENSTEAPAQFAMQEIINNEQEQPAAEENHSEQMEEQKEAAPAIQESELPVSEPVAAQEIAHEAQTISPGADLEVAQKQPENARDKNISEEPLSFDEHLKENTTEPQEEKLDEVSTMSVDKAVVISKRGKKLTALFLSLAVLFLASTVTLSICVYWLYHQWISTDKKLDDAQKELADTQARLDVERIASSNYRQQSQQLQSTYNSLLESPVFVRITRVYNQANNSNTLDHTKITYLGINFQVSSASTISKSEKLYIKIIDSYGRLSTGNSSPSGYSFAVTISDTQFGWGSDRPGSYLGGPHTIEFWYRGGCVGRKTIFIQ